MSAQGRSKTLAESNRLCLECQFEATERVGTAQTGFFEALKLLCDDGRVMGTSHLLWKAVRNTSMTDIQQKREEHRCDGLGSFDMSKAAMVDLLERKKTIPYYFSLVYRELRRSIHV